MGCNRIGDPLWSACASACLHTSTEANATVVLQAQFHLYAELEAQGKAEWSELCCEACVPSCVLTWLLSFYCLAVSDDLDVQQGHTQRFQLPSKYEQVVSAGSNCITACI